MLSHPPPPGEGSPTWRTQNGSQGATESQTKTSNVLPSLNCLHWLLKCLHFQLFDKLIRGVLSFKISRSWYTQLVESRVIFLIRGKWYIFIKSPTTESLLCARQGGQKRHFRTVSLRNFQLSTDCWYSVWGLRQDAGQGAMGRHREGLTQLTQKETASQGRWLVISLEFWWLCKSWLAKE